MTDHRPHPIAQAIAERIRNHPKYDVTTYASGLFLMIAMLADGYFDDLLPPARQPVLCDETVQWLCANTCAFMQTGQLSDRMIEHGLDKESPLFARIFADICALERWHAERREGT